MKKIVDASYLRDNRLRHYLSEDRDNYVLFTDYACMESLKGRSLINIRKSVEIVSEFPEQILVLRNTTDIIKDDLFHLHRGDLFIDEDQTGGFRNFCLGVRKASEGNSFYSEQLLEKSELASLEIERKKKYYANLILKGLQKFNEELDQKFVKVLRSGKPWGADEYDYIWNMVIDLCKLMFEKFNKWPDKKTFSRHYIFRYSLAGQLLALKWLREGGWDSYPEEKINNDMIDMSYVAYATYFDGVLSKDNKINDLYKLSNKFLEQLNKG